MTSEVRNNKGMLLTLTGCGHADSMKKNKKHILLPDKTQWPMSCSQSKSSKRKPYLK